MSDDGGDGDDDGYVHDPAAVEDASDGEEQRREYTTAAYLDDDAPDGGFGRRGWLLVAAVFVSFLVVPGLILLLPAARPTIESLGLTYRDAYLTLPLVPALLLGTLAVWTALEHRRGG